MATANGQPQTPRMRIPQNIYTAMLGISLGVLVFSLAYVAYQCWTQYGTLLPITR
ncbi:MAG: hypothetical protein QHH07_05150 [Sedimentisphaerales bacterium]|nr:hypothetical protein [Sedimentisphaerales bacterium]